MKKTGLFVIAIAALFAVACGGGENKLVPDKKYNYKYPTDCVGGRAVWWEMHENRICEEPWINTVADDDYSQEVLYSVKLDLRNCGFLGINDYFGRLFAAGYMYNQDYNKHPMEEWLNWPKEWKELHTYLYQQADPYTMFGSTYYKTTWQIELIGTLSDFYLDDNPSLTIMYRYSHERE